MRVQRLMWWLLIPALLLAFWLGARGLDADPIWQDEYFQVRDVRTSNDPIALAVHIAAANPWHVPSYFIILNNWGRLFDWNPVPMRAMALFIGMLGIAWTYRLGRDHFSRRVGLYAAVVLAASAFYVYYGHELRMYTLNAMLAALVLWLYLRLVRMPREPGWGALLAFLLSMILAFYTHYFLSIFLASIGLYHLLFVPKSRRWWKVAAAIGLAGLAFLPWLSVFLRTTRRVARSGFGGHLEAGDALRELAYVFSNGQVAILLLVLALAVLALWHGSARRNLGAAWFVLVVTMAIVLVANHFVKFLAAERLRYIILIWSPLSLLVAAGILQLGALFPRRPALQHAAPLLALGVWLVIGFWNSLTILSAHNIIGYQPYFQMQKVFRVLHDLHAPGDYIVHIIPDDDDGNDYRRAIDFYPENARLAADSEVLGRIHDGQPASPERQQSIIRAIGADRHYVWVAYPSDPVPSLREEFEAGLSGRYGLCGVVVRRADFSVDELAPSPVCCTPDAVSRPAQVVFGGLVELVGIELQPDFAARQLNWYASFKDADRLPPDTYSIATHVLDAQGNLTAQSDYPLPADDFLCERHTLSLDGLTAGHYEVRVAVYNWQTGERLPGVVPATGEQGDLLPVAGFDIP